MAKYQQCEDCGRLFKPLQADYACYLDLHYCRNCGDIRTHGTTTINRLEYLKLLEVLPHRKNRVVAKQARYDAYMTADEYYSRLAKIIERDE